MEYYKELAISKNAEALLDAANRQNFLRLSQLCMGKCWTFETAKPSTREQQCLEACQTALFRKDLPLYYKYFG